MSELNSKARLAQEIKASPHDSFSDALKVADDMSISLVREVLEEEIASNDAVLCHCFIEQWLERFEPLQKLAATIEVSHLYLLDLVDVPHAEDLILLRTLDNGADAVAALRSEVLSNRDLGRNPDASFGLKFVKTIEAEVCDPLETAIERLHENSERLGVLIQRADDEVKDQG
ncbi:hypothetical protein QP572_09385 [Brevibacterium sp. UMB10442]|uniref:hypothetical protein n=1 Tax=Brevibacterium sp. UMB1308A TaxID=3050608 RepID=UPI00254C17FC|nr:hypothetical protein [Brevibacterium sp. UMB1308A]MDK7750562.1 hypothetical protein [Brevibacterium sp. UMB10442]MDK8347292.1 hypothetical protein [Brevibacterium sp. UMB1308B]MDK8713422.1 hypothetical protein [Brevibacterium sp. UMB1308A]